MTHPMLLYNIHPMYICILYLVEIHKIKTVICTVSLYVFLFFDLNAICIYNCMKCQHVSISQISQVLALMKGPDKIILLTKKNEF